MNARRRGGGAAWLCTGVAAVAVLLPVITLAQGEPQKATTTLTISICGDAVVNAGEVCDDGVAKNDGAYATSTATRRCNASCNGFGPYCGDDILQTLFGEECDDGNNVSGDLCSSVCLNEVPPTTNPGGTGGGGGGGSSGGKNPEGSSDGSIELDTPTEVRVEGIAYPGATVSILIDGEVEEVLEADGDGVFDHTFRTLTPGATTFGFWAEDAEGRKSITYSSTFEVVEGAKTTVSTVFVPPTISVTPEKAALGQEVTLRGYAAPEHDVVASVDNGDLLATTTSAKSGAWLVALTTEALENESFHSAKARYQDPQNTQNESGFSQLVSFYVGVRDVDSLISPDINQDERVDLVDFSILLFNWGTSAALADFNRDGTVDLADFSIMLFSWTG